MRKSMRGMTLVELLTVMAIVALLGSIAYTTYRNSVIRSNRTEATAALLSVAAAQEKFYLQNNTYASDDQLEDPPPTGLGLSRTTANGYYTIALDTGAQDDLTQTFGATATPTSTGGQGDDDDCTAFTIDETGQKGASGAADANTRCWR
jgi:type IV pilus assembly protein PilE